MPPDGAEAAGSSGDGGDGGDGGGGGGALHAFAPPVGHLAQRIIAQPVDCGSVLLFSHRVLHWGSAPFPPPPGCSGTTIAPPPPRIALSLAYADPDFEVPYLRAEGDGESEGVDAEGAKDSPPPAAAAGTAPSVSGGPPTFPPHESRAALLAAQGLMYNHQHRLTPALAALYCEALETADAARVLAPG
jgi:hypothetical protein